MQRGHIYPVGLIFFFIIIFIIMITIIIITIIIAIIIFFGLFGDTRRLLLQFTFLWSSAKGEWHSKSLNTIERCSKVKFSSEALLKQILGSPFLDVRLKSKSHVTSDYRYFNSVIWIMVSNTVEALFFPPEPRLSYESSMCSVFLHINCWLKIVLRFVCKHVVCPFAKRELYQHVTDSVFGCC